MAERTSGVVKRLVRDKGFGFILGDTGGDECFFHRSAAPDYDDLMEGSRVDYIRTHGPKGARAEDVRRVG